MAHIPVGTVAFEGFGLIRRKPVAVLIWGLVLLAFFVLMLGWVTSLLGSVWQAAGEADGAEPPLGDVVALQMQLMAFQFGAWLMSILMRVVLTCAVYRAVLDPQDDRFAYMRLGKTELLVALALMCLSIILGIMLVGGVLVTMGVAMAGWAASKPLGIGLGILVATALLAVFVWVTLRLSMSLPMSFAERRFRFFEAWELTRGHVGSLLLVMLIVVAIVLLVEIAVVGVVAAAVAAIAAGGVFDQASLEAFFQRPPDQWLLALGPIALVGAVALAVVLAALQAIATAPWAAAYRALAAPAETPSPEGAVPS